MINARMLGLGLLSASMLLVGCASPAGPRAADVATTAAVPASTALPTTSTSVAAPLTTTTTADDPLASLPADFTLCDVEVNSADVTRLAAAGAQPALVPFQNTAQFASVEFALMVSEVSRELPLEDEGEAKLLSACVVGPAPAPPGADASVTFLFINRGTIPTVYRVDGFQIADDRDEPTVGIQFEGKCAPSDPMPMPAKSYTFFTCDLDIPDSPSDTSNGRFGFVVSPEEFLEWWYSPDATWEANLRYSLEPLG